MRMIRSLWSVLFVVLVCLGASLSVMVADGSSGDSNFTVNAEYDSNTGILTYSGTSDSGIVNVVVYGHNYVSSVCASIVTEGHFSDHFYLGPLSDGSYSVRFTGNGYDEETTFRVGSSDILLNAADYDARTGIVTFSGTSSTSLVNVRVYSDDYISPIDACVVNNGVFSDSFYLGPLKPGTYRLAATSNGCVAEKTFVATTEYISNVSLSFDNGLLSYEGYSSSEIVNVVVYGHEYTSSINASVVSGGRFSDIFYLGDLNAGTYTVKFTGKNCFVDKQFTVGSAEDPYAADSIYSADGRTLIEYHGSVSEYVLPVSIERVADGAFETASIGRFVLTKDVVWDIKIHNNMFPLQSAGVGEIVIQEGVTEIPDYLFASTGISSLILPSSVESVGVKAFYLCPNLTNVTVEDSNHLKMLGEYAFGTNNALTSISFGSSEDGYSCSLEKGCFYKCGAMEVRLNQNFNLYSIGDGAFANTTVRMLIGEEIGDKIHIPGTVGNIGNYAFSDAIDTISDVEPGKNTMRFSDMLIVTKYGTNGVTGKTIVFEPNTYLTSIGRGCFAWTNPVDLIDLSHCSALEEIEPLAFAYCLDAGSDGLMLSSNIKTIGQAAFESRGEAIANNNTLVLPASLERLDSFAFERICSYISFEERSELRYFDGSPTAGQYSLIDLSNCCHLEELGQYCTSNPMKMPVGVYNSYRGRLPQYVDETPVVSVNNGVLTIASDTVGLISGDFVNLNEIRIDSSNPYFEMIGNSLYLKNGEARILVYVLNDKSFTIGDNCSSVGSGALGHSVRTLRINNPHAEMESSIVSEASGLKNVYIGCNPISWDVSVAFDGIGEGVTFYVLDSLSIQDQAYLRTIGEVYVGYKVSGSTLYLPMEYEGKTVSYTDIAITDTSFSARVFVGGFISEELDFVVTGAKATYDGGKITIDCISATESYLRLFTVEPYDEEMVAITFDGNGGHNSTGDESVVLSVILGSVLGQNTIPDVSKEQSVFMGWFDDEGVEYTGNTRIMHDMVVHARWQSRSPVLNVDQTTATITIDGNIVCGQSFVVLGTVTLMAEPKSGYELGRWILNGTDMGPACDPLTINGLTGDSSLQVTGTYYSQSTGMNSINNRRMPTTEEISEIVHSFTVGGYVETNGSVWTGMVSIPLVVDDYIFVRIADRLYKVESDTGYVVKSVGSSSKETFYHYIGYGGGYIIDYNTSKVYDTDLNQLYVLDRNIDSADYYGGKFYVLGKNVYVFDPADIDKTRTDEVKSLDYVGKIDNIYGQYGIISHEFVDGVVYCITTRGDDRGVVALDLSTGEASYKTLDGLRTMYLDDGWITYYRGYLFVTAYSVGLFGAVATTHNDRVSYIPVEGMTFGEERYYEFSTNTFSSRFAFYDNRAFVTMGGTLYVFDMPNDMTNLDLSQLSRRSTTLASGHGNFVLDVSHAGEEGSPVYAYGIPYDTHHGETMWIAVDRAGTVSSVPIYSTEREWNSQTVRSDIDGRMLWYNDSGWLYSYTTSDKNVYYFFIEDGDSAMWYRAYGVNAADALAFLGSDVATLNAAKIIQTVNGHSVTGGMTLQMLKATYGTTDNNGQFNNLDQYSWVTISNLGDTSYSLNHYFRIICGNGTSVSTSDVFTYIDNGETKTYTFADNIGDRGIIGKQLSRGTDVVFIRFTEDDTEIPGATAIVKRGSEAKVHFPDVVKVGHIPIWNNASGEEVADIYGSTFSSDATFRLHWEEIPAGYMVSGTMDVTNGVTTWSADVDIRTGIGTTEGLSIKVTAVTSDGRILTDMETTGTNGLASGSLDAANIRLLYIRIVDEHVEGNLGYVMIEREATS